MTFERIALVVSIFLFCLASYFTLRTPPATTDPAASVTGFFLYRAHCPTPEPTPASTSGHLHLLQANFPF